MKKENFSTRAEAVRRELYFKAGRGRDELAALNRSGRTQIPDPAATAAVAIGSLSYAATLQSLTGRLPGNIAEERYIEAWVNQTLSVLRQYRMSEAPKAKAHQHISGVKP